MNASVDPKHWDALMKLLNDADSSLAKRNTGQIEKSLALYARTVQKLGLKDLADLAGRFDLFYRKSVLPAWDEEAVATMSFSLGALVEKMQRHPYGDAFSAGLVEIYEFLEVYTEEEPGGDQDVPAEAASPHEPAVAPAVQESKGVSEARDSEATAGMDLAKFREQVPPPTTEDPDLSSAMVRPPAEPSVEVAAGVSPDAGETPRARPPDEPSPTSVRPHDSASQPARSPQPVSGSREGTPLPGIEPTPGLGPVEALQGTAADSRELLSQMLARDPGSHVFVDLAEALCLDARWSEAVDLCRAGIHLHPRITRARVLLGWALAELGQTVESFTTLQGARQQLEEDAILYRLLAEIAASGGDADSAAHLESLYSALRPQGDVSLAERPPRSDAAPSRTAETCPETRRDFALPDSGTRQVELLGALLRRFEERPTASASKPCLLPEDARKTLRRMLHGQGRA